MGKSPQQLLRDVDLLNDQIRDIEKQKTKIFQKLADYKIQIEQEHSFMIGKKAMCIHVDNERPMECVCTGVVALDDYENVRPLFSRNGKKYITESYEWIP